MAQLQKLIRDKKIDYKNSRKIFDEIIKKNPTKLEYKRSYAEQIKREFEEIEIGNSILVELEQDYLKLIDTNPHDWNTYMTLGYMCGGLKDYEKSLKYFEKARDILSEDITNDNLTLAFFKISSLKEKLNDFKGAIECFDTTINTYEYLISLQENKKNIKILSDYTLKLSDEYKRRGHIKRRIKNKGFIKDYKKAFELNPAHAYWMSVIGEFYFEKKDYDNYQKYLDLWIDTDDFFELRIRKKNHPKMLSITLKSYILKLFEIGKEKKSLNLCKELIQKEITDHELPNIFSLLNEFYLIKKSKTEIQYSKWVKSKRFRLKKLKKKLDEFIETNPDFELSSRIKYEPSEWKKPNYWELLKKRRKSREVEEKLIMNALDELENDIFLASELFETKPYKLINVQLKHNRKHLRMFEK